MQKTAYEMRISDWSSDVCSSDLAADVAFPEAREDASEIAAEGADPAALAQIRGARGRVAVEPVEHVRDVAVDVMDHAVLEAALRSLEVERRVDALVAPSLAAARMQPRRGADPPGGAPAIAHQPDRKSTRLNSSH